MSRYLTELADWLRAAGLDVVEMDGWQSRARSSGGYADGQPLCVMWHHTASGPSADGASDANYIATGSPDAPIANLYIERSGRVWVVAAGATNTNGKGKAVAFSRGTVKADTMNTCAVGIELGNGGTGEPWPESQLNAAFLASNAINTQCGNEPGDICTHQFYAPDRKIDPATAAAVQGPWQPASVTSSGSWDVNDVGNECWVRAGDEPAPGPDPLPPMPGPDPDGDDEMKLTCVTDPNGTIWVGNGLQRRALTSMDQFNQYVVLSNSQSGNPLVSINGVAVRDVSNVAAVGWPTLEGMGVEIT